MLNAVIDLSHHNGPVDLVEASGAGIVGVIHKATQGVGYVDPKYTERASLAREIGLLWGAYHFGNNDDGAKQAGHFLANVNDGPTLLALDVEENVQGGSMELRQIYDFIQTVQTATGRWPGIYGGFYLRQLLAGQPDAMLANCWLWVSDYRVAPAPEIPAAWQDWTLWQYTDGEAGNMPKQVSGIGGCDRDIFNGDEDGLRKFWTGGQP